MTLTEVCPDLQAWLSVLGELITEPDTQPTIGRTAPGSTPPWNTAAANAMMDIHALVRELEQNLRYQVTGTLIVRGGSHGNTVAALETIPRLAEAVPRDVAEQHAHLISRQITIVMQLPAIDLEERWRPVPAPCPRCQRPMLRACLRDGRVGCLGCTHRGQMMPGTVSDGYIQWDDGELT
jgi:hypothetical protein